VEITVVGAGVVGCAVAWELARAGHEVVLVEKNPGVTRGENQSSRNSGVVHAGLYYDQATRPLKSRLCVAGNALLYDFCRQHGVPARQTGKLIVAVKAAELDMLDTYRRRAQENGVPVELLDGEAVRGREPRVKARAALLLPTSGIVEPTALVGRLHHLACGHGVQFFPETRVTGLALKSDGIAVTLEYRDGARDTYLSRRLVNAAGLYSDDIAGLLDPASPYRVDPVRSETMKFYRTRRADLHLNGMNIYPTPRRVTTPRGSYFTVGVHLTPTLDTESPARNAIGSTVTVGPLNLAARSKSDYGGPFQPVGVFLDAVQPFFPGLQTDDLEPHQTGIQARLAGCQDWLIDFSPQSRRCLNLLGIDSPGLTGSLAIARHVRSMLE
jgi:L-2-hydroxyglutarate oxidase LhgO